MKAWLRLALVTTTVGGGFAGVVFNTVAIRAAFQGQRLIAWPTIVFFLILNIYVTASGLIFVQYPHKTRPLLVALAIQIPRIWSPFLVYGFSTGLQFALGVIASTTETGGRAITLDWTGVNFGTFGMFGMFHEQPLGLGVNFWALLMLVLLLRSVRMTVPVTRHANSSHMEPSLQDSDN
jgi:hypothetical protein